MKHLFNLIIVFGILCFTACKNEDKTTPNLENSNTLQEKESIPFFENKEAFFGETHVHTGVSMDAFIGGSRMSPADAYRFAKGEEMMVNGSLHKLKRPLDFAAVSDHAEFFGETFTLMTEGSPGYDHPIAVQMRDASDYDTAMGLFIKYVATPARQGGNPHPVFFQGEESIKSGWRNNFDATEAHYEPGKFTTLHAFEWSAAPNAGNLHRNVIFRDTIVPSLPFSYNDSRDPQKLWAWMQQQIDNGSTVLAIPHNSNASKGLMFPEVDLDGNPISAEYAQIRQNMEPLIEIMQIKGNSEVHSNFWKNDEFANFELTNSIQDYSGRKFEERNYVRYGLKRGLKYKADLGVNPFKFGINGGTDSHNGTPSNVEEDNYQVGSHGLADRTAENRTKREVDGWALASDLTTGSLTGVWAESNTRGAIWDAMKRKETFATSGPRIKVRLFGGYGYKEEHVSYSDLVSDGYAKGVPMGGDLKKGDSNPQFLVWAIKDPIAPGLDRIQIIKGWYEKGEMKEEINNLAASDNRLRPDGSVRPTEAKVNLETGAFDNTKGSTELVAIWEDKAFDPDQHAFYYVRVIQLPTARWTLWDELREGVTYRPGVPKTLQERAWSSPIWYSP
jgi:hypothetical protein